MHFLFKEIKMSKCPKCKIKLVWYNIYWSCPSCHKEWKSLIACAGCGKKIPHDDEDFDADTLCNDCIEAIKNATRISIKFFMVCKIR